MDIDAINPYCMKIILAVRKEDSINALARRMRVSYGWVYKWVHILAEKGVFTLTRMKTILHESNPFYKKTISYLKTIADVQFYYEALSLLGISYCFTQTDAVFVWTKGGYNIARNKLFYPIFVKIKKKDEKIFEEYAKRLHLPVNHKQGISYHVVFEEDFQISFCEGVPVDPLENTISFMEKYIYNFQPALEMIQDMYQKKLKVKYKEVVTRD
ncbi:helix-turn-helix domain-containing protein [Candidatus Woesearchaeota archaeon]|nr:helix-turn-helix domain-containing protein [Candidatus Woesearchaeota archaeon]